MEIIDLLKIYTSKNIAKLIYKYFYFNNPLEEENYIEINRSNIKIFNTCNINIINLMIEKGFNNYDFNWIYTTKINYKKLKNEKLFLNTKRKWKFKIYMICVILPLVFHYI